MSDTICHKFLDTAKKHPDRTAIMYKRSERWIELTWAGYREVVQTIAAGLQTLGVRKGDRVAIYANTRYEWAASDLAILGLGAITVPIYQSSTSDDVGFTLNDSGAKILICETVAMAEKVRDTIKDAKSIEHVIVFDARDRNAELSEPALRYVSFEEVQMKGETALKRSPTLYELGVRELSHDDLATIIYTSGTTGRPRGVEHTHTQVLSEVADAFPLLGVTMRDRSLTFLPFAHVMGRIEIWGHALIGYTMAFAQSIERLRDDLIEIKPSLMVAVPRVFEKIYNGVLAQAEISPLKSRVFKWALEIGREISQHKVDKQPVPLDLALKYQVARRLVFNGLNERLGGNLRFAVSGGAPLAQSIAEFFHAAGLLILEGYGLTETMAAIAVNTPFDYRFGTVGKAIGDVKLKLADDGEILVQSKKVMRAYHNDPQATAAALKDGWFHTGDIGEISPEGYVRVTDRKKDLIKTAGGKYVAPQRLEGLLKANRFISQVHIHGDQKKYIVALLTLNTDAIREYASQNDVPTKDQAALVENPKIKDLIRRAVADANSHLASFESIKNFGILPKEFTIESGELTPSLKVKSKVVDLKYHDLIEKLYGVEN
jgi:long-chain acyl-CoA synthetase